jgi:uncharacterized membrane protein YphA (DoxX/SURF4 family)
MNIYKESSRWLFTVLRTVTGWHFLYEGIAKAFNPGWSSTSYLMESKWLFSGFFHWITGNGTALGIVDFLNIWGLIAIGACLFLGLFTRISAIAGTFLLLLYYIANPPFMPSSYPSTSHFYIINYNLLEAVVLIVIAAFPANYLYSVQRWILLTHSERKDAKFPPKDNHEIIESHDTSRRELIKNLAVIPIFGAAFFGMAKKRGWFSFEEDNLVRKSDAVSGASLVLGRDYSIRELRGQVPQGRIRDVPLSRIIIGGNLISGFAHSRDLIYVSTWLKKYFTDEKVIETLWLCEACGINTAILRCDENTIRILEKYWQRGGRVKWLAQTYPDNNDLSNIQTAIDHGAIGAFIHGGIADKIISGNRIDHIRKPIEYIKSRGLIAGTAAHSLMVPKACVENDIKPDFFMKTYHHHNYWSVTPVDPSSHELPVDGDDHNMAHDNIWCMSDKLTAGFFRDQEIPWIAYKVLAAGAIKPEDGIRYAFEGGADFVCLGMFDFQVIENANIAFDIFSSKISRDRPWYS